MRSGSKTHADRRIRVCFLFNAQRHQLLHGISVAVELARKPRFEVTVLSPSREHIEYACQSVDRLGGAPIKFEIAETQILKFLQAVTGRSIQPKKLTLGSIIPKLKTFDAIAIPERTSLILKTLGVRGPSFVHLDHGAGDRAVGFDPRIKQFDFVLMAGEKHRQRLLREGLIRDGAYAVVGYPKFEAAEAARDADWHPFRGDDRPIVLYNPHFTALGSWEKFGAKVLKAFAEQDRYNLILAPHVRLLDGDQAWSRWRDTITPYLGHPRIYFDRGSNRSIDMTYTTLADVYLGDVSSQVYEFLWNPRPCAFLDASGVSWQGDENYAHWNFGPVLRDTDGLLEAIDDARDRHPAFKLQQEAGFALTFDRAGTDGSQRAAHAIGTFLIDRRRTIEARRQRRVDQGRRQVQRAATLSRRIAMILPALVAGWLLNDFVTPTPTYASPFVDEAAQSLNVLLVRDEMRSQPSTPEYDVSEIRDATSLLMPNLPEGWRALDVQVFPSDFGASVQVLVETPDRSRVAFVGMRVETDADRKPQIAVRNNDSVVYWENGDMAYALVGKLPAKTLLDLSSQVA